MADNNHQDKPQGKKPTLPPGYAPEAKKPTLPPGMEKQSKKPTLPPGMEKSKKPTLPPGMQPAGKRKPAMPPGTTAGQKGPKPTLPPGLAGGDGAPSRKDFASDQDVRWCPGCGDYSILAAVQLLLPELDIPKENLVFISGIGCSGRFPYYMNTYGMHTIHGRAPSFATGLKASRPELDVWIVTG